MNHQFQFDKNRKRAELCPCGKSNKDKKFSPYKGYTDKGYCHGCSRNFLPEQEKENNLFITHSYTKPVTKKENKPSLIDINLFNKSLSHFDDNNFIVYLKSVFAPHLVDQAVSKYKIGTSKHWKGASIFWQLDDLGNVRTGKVMLYDSNVGKRVKNPFDHITWVHSILKLKDFNLGQVFFGTHLSKLSTNTIAIVESEKTAIIASICFPDFTWLAAGSKDGLKMDKFSTLKHRSIVLYPDANAYDLWINFANQNIKELKIKVSEHLNVSISDEDKAKGEDIADYLLKSIPDILRVNYTQESLIENNHIRVGCDKIQEYTDINPNLNALTSRLNLVIDPDPSENSNWQNDIPATIKAIKLEIEPHMLYHLDDIQKMINKYHLALNVNYQIIIQKLIDHKVLVQNPFDSSLYFMAGSTPF